ncbi:hypothetical protein [Glycomyces buryatensis]|uniref:Extensin-like C-terminal domain-containing protein n=1 Tax=Glycomyces buryatensis TaxID=2570927 RepID=A0A4S8QF65_9ACTN|nr:hypothetical protein [Glycomyces buryatensis]THV43010.1 hypothetical protein FAB82_03385 [Glycomyces buryatensis]
MPFPSSSQAFARSKCGYPDVTRNYLADKRWKTRFRTAFNGDGYGVHPSSTSFTMHEEIHTQAGKIVRDLHELGQRYAPRGETWSYGWTGVAGTKVCKPGYHRYGAAIDFTKFNWGPGQFVDLAVHGKDERLHLRRRYLAAIAICRKYFGTVLHCHNDPDGSHWNHIHADRGRQAVALDWDYGTDVTVIQWAARDLAGFKGMSIDGDWGPQSLEGLRLLRAKFRADGVDPTASPVLGRRWLDLIARHGMADKAAGTYTADS